MNLAISVRHAVRGGKSWEEGRSSSVGALRVRLTLMHVVQITRVITHTSRGVPNIFDGAHIPYDILLYVGVFMFARPILCPLPLQTNPMTLSRVARTGFRNLRPFRKLSHIILHI